MYNGKNLQNTLNAKSSSEIDLVLESMAPSLAEYYILNSIDKDEVVDAPRSNYIQSVIYFGNYAIYTDYNNDIFIEESSNNDDSKQLMF